ncbi:MAG: RluA family pseudouridine synthase [Clostridia bacterium]|nr:RluA family pseudouridine synthase [Clostridia bacterium]MBQ5770019.1 RluA family pseudouridine synthase [Clostridia bacterium]
MDIEILYEDKYLLACVKPTGILSEDGGMPDLLSAQLGAKRIYCVHRLDKDVGGVMIFAKDGKTAQLLSEAISAHKAKKEYLLICQGAPEEKTGTFKDLLYHDKQKNKTYVVKRERKGVKDAELDYEVLSSDAENAVSIVKATLKTGRSHQIRVQFASRKMPLAGDGKYGSSIKTPQIALWSFKYSFAHPVSGETITASKMPPIENQWTAFEEILKTI